MAKDYDQLLYNELTKKDWDLFKVRKFVKRGGSLNFTIDKKGTTPLIKSIKKNWGLNELFLKKGVNLNVNAFNNKGNTALILVINTDRGKIDIESVRLLIESGADLNHKNKKGMTALEYAVGHNVDNSLEAVKILLENGADISKCKNNLLREINKWADGHEKIREILKEYGAKAEPFFIQYNLKTKCMECGKFNPVNFPAQNIICDHCQSNIELNDNIWQTIFEYDSGLFSSSGYEIDIDKQETKPVCTNHKCKEEINIEEIQIGNNKAILCKKCGIEIQNYPAPDWLKNYSEYDTTPAQIIGADQPRKPEFKTVVIKCTSCSASIKIQEETPKLCICEHCQTQQYLPDDIWLKLHPVNKRELWYILFKE